MAEFAALMPGVCHTEEYAPPDWPEFGKPSISGKIAYFAPAGALGFVTKI
jgi:hypothetical protein